MTARERILTDLARESAAKAAHLTEGQSARSDHGAARLENQAAEAGVTTGGTEGAQGRAGFAMGGRAFLADDDWRSSAEERDAWWHTDWGVGGDW